MLELGPHGFSIAESVPMAEAREKVGGRIALVGNVNQLFYTYQKGAERSNGGIEEVYRRKN